MTQFPRWSCAPLSPLFELVNGARRSIQLSTLPVFGSFRLFQGGGWLAFIVTVLVLCLGPRQAEANAAIYGGGPFYNNASAHLTEIKNAGFEEAVVWNIAVNTSGDLNFNYEFPLCAGGAYVGNATHADFRLNLLSLKQGGVRRLTFSVGSSNPGVFQAIQSLVNSQGTGASSILYRNFQALKQAIPGVDAIDFDDENCYDQSSMVKFAVMLGNLGYKVSLCPYTNSSFWKSVATQINNQLPGTVDRVHLQCYDGGAGNSPNSTWNFGTIPVYPGLWDSKDTPNSVQTKLAAWRSQYGIVGGFLWLYDDFVGNGLAAQYAAAINNAVPVITPAVNSATSASGTMGAAFSYQITATNSPAGYGAANLPPGLSVNAGTGVISGAPTQTGAFTVTVSATNAAGTGSGTLTISVQSPFTAWRRQNFTAPELADDTVSGPNATPAGDGISNLLKYALGLNPKANGTAGLPTATITASGGSNYLSLRYTKVIAASDLTYTVEISGDQQTWSSGSGYTTTILTVNNADGITQTVYQRDLTPVGSTAARFIRLKVSQP